MLTGKATGVAVDIPGVPESVPWTVIRDFLTNLGIDPKRVQSGGVHLGHNVITCTVFALDENGGPYADLATREVAVHKVAIRVDWDDADD